MTAETLAATLGALPGLLERPSHARGLWHIQIQPAALPDAMRRLFDTARVTLFMMAGEDRLQRGEMRVHYLLELAMSKEPAPMRELLHVEVVLPRDAPAVPTLAALSFPASRFEREMRDQLGITPSGHPDPRPLVRHGFWPGTFHPLREDAIVPEFPDDGQPFPFTPVEGAGVFEIPVGPVHAGVIEPGHFRFNVLGETILKMRARLYFTHKGTERLFAGRTPDEGVVIAERVSGDTSAGHAVAFCQAVEALAGTEAPPRARAIRTVLLELERLYNHITDVGAIVADTGFPVGQSHCMRLREGVLRLNKRLTGHRLLRGVIVPGGVVGVGLPDDNVVSELRRILTDFNEVVEICVNNTLVKDRLESTGTLGADVADDFGVVGYVARACGVGRDVRADFPFAAYGGLDVTPVVEHDGDVRARLQVRVREVVQSVAIIEQVLAAPAAQPELRASLGPLPPFTAAFGLVEAWRGRLVHMVVAGADGRLHRVKIVDPSFFNWPALARALDGNIVPDFPLCNKSFNQSYSGNDL